VLLKNPAQLGGQFGAGLPVVVGGSVLAVALLEAVCVVFQGADETVVALALGDACGEALEGCGRLWEGAAGGHR
jgi:hypothetical protein